MKYIVIRITDHATRDGMEDMQREVPFVFPLCCTHSEVARYMRRMLRDEQPDGRMREIEVVSAGFISSMAVGDGKNQCHGKSESLGDLPSRPGVDDKLLHMHDYLHGII